MRVLSRRQTLTALGTLPMTPLLHSPMTMPPPHSFTLCLNMSTIMGHKLGFAAELETAARAGFRSVEIWLSTLQEFLKTNTLADAYRRINDLGLTVENAIGFAP